MAKRKRLIPSPLSPGFDPDMAENGPSGPLETKAYLRPGLGDGMAGSTPPIAQVAADASARAALAELSEAMARARREGRLVQSLPLSAVDPTHLVRDRIGLDEEELGHLMASIRDHGQRTPIEVTELPDGRFGLISGWRRLQALTRLLDATGEAKYGSVQALLRRPEAASDAYVAMVEENEVRQGLSYYERARIAARAVDLGVFDSERQALQQLFTAASRARRSKIGSFLSVYRALDDALRFPAAIPERLGLALAKAVVERPGDVAAFAAEVKGAPPADPAEELSRLQALSVGQKGSKPAKKDSKGASDGTRKELRPGVFLDISGGFTRPVLTLSGPGVDPGFRERLEAWLSGAVDAGRGQ